uniref:Sushi domain-containing protein n=1 Tax=Oryzias latipes TaxID=8090 RepID=A0A3P9H3J1_ORYLA
MSHFYPPGTTCSRPDVKHGEQITSRERTSYSNGDRLTYECVLPNDRISVPITCERGSWSGIKSCISEPCEPPPKVQNAVIETPYLREYVSVEYVCPRYYKMEGGPLTCRNGQWTGRVRCIKEMDRNNLQLLKDWLDKVYLEHNDHITFRCKSGKRHDGRVAMRQQCIEGVIQLPTCV